MKFFVKTYFLEGKMGFFNPFNEGHKGHFALLKKKKKIKLPISGLPCCQTKPLPFPLSLSPPSPSAQARLPLLQIMTKLL